MLPNAVANWKSVNKCYGHFSKSGYSGADEYLHSEDSVIKESSIGIPDSILGVGVKLTGSSSPESSFIKKKTKTFQMHFQQTQFACEVYDFSLNTNNLPLNTDFVNSIKKLPSTYKPLDSSYIDFIKTFGTHYTSRVILGGKIKHIMSYHTCTAGAFNMGQTKFSDCMTINITANPVQIVSKFLKHINLPFDTTFTTSINPSCETIVNKFKDTVSKTTYGYDTFIAIEGGSRETAVAWFFADDVNVQNIYKRWIGEVDKTPGLIKYGLTPIAHLVKQVDEGKAERLLCAVDDYFKEKESIENSQTLCDFTCPLKQQYGSDDDCSCGCGNQYQYLSADCCPLLSGQGHLKLTILRIENIGDHDGWIDDINEVFVKVNMQGKDWQTRTISGKEGTTIEWNDEKDQGIVQGGLPFILQVIEEDTFTNDDNLGMCYGIVDTKHGERSCHLFKGGQLYYQLDFECLPYYKGDHCEKFDPTGTEKHGQRHRQPKQLRSYPREGDKCPVFDPTNSTWVNQSHLLITILMCLITIIMFKFNYII